MSFELRTRTYDWKDLLRLPFLCEPLCTAAVVGQKLLTGVVNVLWVLVEAKFIDTVLACAVGKNSIRSVYPLLAVMLLIIIWKRMGWNLGRIPSVKLLISAEYQVKRETVKKRSRIHYRLVENSKAWELSKRVSEELNRNIARMLPDTCDFLMSMVRIGGVLLIIFAESMWLGLLMLLIMLPLLYVSAKGGGRVYKAYQDASAYERRGEYLQEIMSGREFVDERTLFAYTEHVNQEWNKQKEGGRIIHLKAQAMQEFRKSGSSILTNIISTIMVLFLIWELSQGKLGVGIFIALSKAIYDVVNIMYNELGYSILGISRYIAFFKDLTAFAALEEIEGTNDLPAEEPFYFESLKLDHVSFRYPGTENYILKDMCMEIKSGRHYSFVGENGAGKTTVTKLFTGLYDAYEGTILLNGKDIKSYTSAQIKSVFSNVYQDFARYQDTVANNILIGNIRKMEDKEAGRQMEQYTRDLGIYEELSALPKGFDTPLGKLESGSVDLSGGQWQRIAMARSLINPAPVQILDEPTAALDPISESRLYEEFERMSEGRTTIFISHRLGSTKLADKIFVLQDGGVLESGTHKELMERHGLYQRMFESQKGWYEREAQETDKENAWKGSAESEQEE